MVGLTPSSILTTSFLTSACSLNSALTLMIGLGAVFILSPEGSLFLKSSGNLFRLSGLLMGVEGRLELLLEIVLGWSSLSRDNPEYHP